MRVPGFVNAHTHIYSGLAPLGMPAPGVAPTNFVEMLQRVWWPLDRAIDEHALRAAARFYVATALLHGTTTLVDHHESPSFIEGSLDVIADACEELGLRAVLCYGATERNGGRLEARRGLAECRRFIMSNDRPLVRGAIGLHASFTVSDDTIREAAALAREFQGVVHVHVAEDVADVADAVRRGYAGPLERLDALGALPAGSILAHGVHLGTAQVRRADARGCWIVQNPRSNRHNRVGYPPALSASTRVAVGTDGFESDMRAELDALVQDAAAHGEDADAVAARADGAACLVGNVWGGARETVPMDEICGWCELDGDRVTRVSVGGQLVVDRGQLQTGDMHEIEAEAREAASALWKRMAHA